MTDCGWTGFVARRSQNRAAPITPGRGVGGAGAGEARGRGGPAMRDANRVLMRADGSAGRSVVVSRGDVGAKRSGGIEGGRWRGAREERLQDERIDGHGGEAQPQEASQLSCPIAHGDVRTSKRRPVKAAREHRGESAGS